LALKESFEIQPVDGKVLSGKVQSQVEVSFDCGSYRLPVIIKDKRKVSRNGKRYIFPEMANPEVELV
jgi:hypothetical protein